MAAKQHTESAVVIKAPRIGRIHLHIKGTAPYVRRGLAQKQWP